MKNKSLMMKIKDKKQKKQLLDHEIDVLTKQIESKTYEKTNIELSITNLNNSITKLSTELEENMKKNI